MLVILNKYYYQSIVYDFIENCHILHRFANKQDIDGALSAEDVEVQFELQHLARKCGSQYKVVSTIFAMFRWGRLYEG